MFKQFSLESISIHTAESQGKRHSMEDKIIPQISITVPFGKDTLTLHTSALFDGHGGNTMASYLQDSFEKYFRKEIDKISNQSGTIQYSEEWDEDKDERRKDPNMKYDISNFIVTSDAAPNATLDAVSNAESDVTFPETSDAMTSDAMTSDAMVSNVIFSNVKKTKFIDLMTIALKETFQLLNDNKPTKPKNYSGSTAVVCVIYEIWGTSGVFCAYVGDSECYIVCRDGSCHNMTPFLHKPDPLSKDYKRVVTLGDEGYDFFGPLLYVDHSGIHRYGNFSMTRAFNDDLVFGYQPTVTHCEMPQDVLGIYLACDGVRESNGATTENGKIVITPSSIAKLIVEYYQNGIFASSIPKCIVDYAIEETHSKDNVSVIWITSN